MVTGEPERETRTRVPDDLHQRRRRPPGHRPRLPAAQASRQGAEVLHVLRHRARLLPRGGRRALHGRPAAGDRSGGAGAARQGQGPRRRPRRGARAVRERPPLRRLLPPRRRPERRLLQRHARGVRSPSRAGRRPAAAAHRGPGRTRPRRRPPRAKALRAASLDGGRRTGAAGLGVPAVGRLALHPPGPGVGRADPRRGAAPPVRAAAGPRRRQALLGLRRRGRQAAPRR
ncbi:hypothetical protein SGPA1_11032 [Streptomyces misionensis JCM 4497]